MNALEKIYNSKYWKQPHRLRAKVKGYSDPFDIDLLYRDGTPDCLMGHFGYNWYIRTPYGIKGKRYKTIKSMLCSILKVARNKGIIIESFGVSRGWRYRPIVTL